MRLAARLQVLLAAFGLSLPLGQHGAAAQTASEPIPVNIGLPNSNYWPAYVARELKLFEKAGFKPNFYVFQSGSPLIAGMKSGSLDVAWTGLATLFMLGQDIPLTYLYTPLDSSSQEGLVVDPKSGIKSFRDLGRAKAIGAPTATCSQIGVVLAARKAGLQTSRLRISNLAPNLLLGALQNGQIDATIIWGPWNLLMKEAGYDIVSWDRDYEPGGGVCATNVAARPDFLRRYPSAGCRLVMVQALTLEAASKDPDIAIRSLEQTLGLSRKIATETFWTLEIPSLESQIEPDSPWSLTSPEGGLAGKLYAAAEALHEAKVFDRPLSLEAIRRSIDPGPVREYLSRHGC